MRADWALVVAALGAAACGSSSPLTDGAVADGPTGSFDGRRDAADAVPGTADARIDGPPGQIDASPDAPIAASCATALLYNDCDPALDANCFSITGSTTDPMHRILHSDEAATRLGIPYLYGGNHDQAAFRSLFDAGGFDLIVFESSSFEIETATANRLAAWVQAGGKIVFSSWDLDGSSYPAAATTLRNALQVTTPASFDTPRSLHDDPASTVSFFDRVETFPSPINFSNIGIDDGDELAPSNGGFISARFTSTTGPGAIAVTRGGHAVVLGFLPIELVYAVVRDGDADGKPDVDEMYTNAMGYLCGL